jgi:capsular polysaccharide biosynthesis protein
VAYLSNTWAENYYHWMQLTLPLLRLYECMTAGTAIQWYYVGEGYSSRAQAETLARVNIRPEQIVREPCSGDRMLAAIYSHPPQHGGVLYRDKRGHDFVRSLFPAWRDDSLPQRIFLLRGPVRTKRVINEEELLRLLRPLGFVPVIMDSMTVVQQAQLFANAKIIVAGHGAALTNLLFAQEGTVVVELFPPNFREASFLAAATHARADYYYVIGVSARRTHDFIVPVSKLAAVLNMAGVR